MTAETSLQQKAALAEPPIISRNNTAADITYPTLQLRMSTMLCHT